MRDALGRVRAVVGIAYRGERTLETTELRALERAVEGLPARSPEQVRERPRGDDVRSDRRSFSGPAGPTSGRDADYLTVPIEEKVEKKALRPS